MLRDLIESRINSRLSALKMTPRAASLKANGKPDTIRNITRGRSDSPQIGTIIAIADALECPVDYLIREEASEDSWSFGMGPSGPPIDVIEKALKSLHELCVASKIAERVPSEEFAAGFIRQLKLLSQIQATEEQDEDKAIAVATGKIVTTLIHETNSAEARANETSAVEPATLKQVAKPD